MQRKQEAGRGALGQEAQVFGTLQSQCGQGRERVGNDWVGLRCRQGSGETGTRTSGKDRKCQRHWDSGVSVVLPWEGARPCDSRGTAGPDIWSGRSQWTHKGNTGRHSTFLPNGSTRTTCLSRATAAWSMTLRPRCLLWWLYWKQMTAFLHFLPFPVQYPHGVPVLSQYTPPSESISRDRNAARHSTSTGRL